MLYTCGEFLQAAHVFFHCQLKIVQTFFSGASWLHSRSVKAENIYQGKCHPKIETILSSLETFQIYLFV
jgi:hypothetical protein